MKKLIGILFILAINCSAVTYDEFNTSLTDLGGGFYSLLLSEAPSGSSDYAWMTNYTDTYALWELTNSGVAITDNSNDGSNDGTNGTAPAASTWYSATNGLSSVRELDAGDIIIVNSDINPIFQTNFSLGVWVQRHDGDAGFIYGNRASADLNDGFTLRYTAADTIVFETYGGVSGSVTSSAYAWDIATWRFISISMDYVNHVIYLYKDGVVCATNDWGASAGADWSNLSENWLGGNPYDGSTNRFDGGLDGLMVWDYVLNSSEHLDMCEQTRYANPDNTYNGVTINCAHGWRAFDYTNRNETWFQAQDYYLSFDQRQISGVAPGRFVQNFGSANPSTTITNTGDITQGGSLSNGISRFGNASSPDTRCPMIGGGTSNWVFMAWVKTDRVASQMIMGSRRTSSRKVQLAVINNNKILMDCRTDVAGSAYGYTAAVWTTGVWHHVCYDFDGSRAAGSRGRVWYDGTNSTVTWNQNPTNVIDTAGSYLQFGTTMDVNDHWIGDIDDVRVWAGNGSDKVFDGAVLTNVINNPPPGIVMGQP